jgi:hypothetical protein
MLPRARPAGLIALAAVGFLLPSPGPARETPKTPGPELSDLALEVKALRTLYYFRFTPEQMKDLQKRAGETAAPARKQTAKASDDFRDALADLRDALVEAFDDDRIDSLDEKLDQLRESETPELDNEVPVTDAAFRVAGEVLRSLTVSQIAAYTAQVADDLTDPLERLTAALDKVRKVQENGYVQRRDEIAEEVSRQVAGLDRKKAGLVKGQVAAFLDKARAYKDEEYKAKRPALEKEARQIIGDVGAFEVLRHEVGLALAELLSNPRLAAALKARLK